MGSSGKVTIDNVGERFPEWENVWKKASELIGFAFYEGPIEFHVSRIGVNNVNDEIVQGQYHQSVLVKVVRRLQVNVLWGSWFFPHIRVRWTLAAVGHKVSRTCTLAQALTEAWGTWRIRRAFRVTYFDDLRRDPHDVPSRHQCIRIEIYEMPKNRFTTIRGLSRLSRQLDLV